MTRAWNLAARAILCASLLTVAGCEERGAEKARQEARQAKTAVASLELRLARALEDYDALKEELAAVRGTRDELQEQVDLLSKDRDTLAQHARQVITDLSAKADGQTTTTAGLENQIKQLKALVDEQQATIEEQMATLEALQGGLTTEANEPDTDTDADVGDEPTEPNQITEQTPD